MEDGLRGAEIRRQALSRVVCLNPCFSGRWSVRRRYNRDDAEEDRVLILVLVEDGLRGESFNQDLSGWDGLNPCFSGRWSASILIKNDSIVLWES